MNSRTPALAKLKAFTLVELIATVAIVAMLAVVLVVFIGGYIADAKRTADRQTLAVLNDALTRYKTQGGSLAALTSGASLGNVLTKLQTAVTWAGMRHQFLKSGTTYTAASIGAIGEGQRYRFTKYGSYADGSAVGSDILETVAAAGYDVGDEAAFDEWITQAMAETGTTNYLALTNPDTTDRFGLDIAIANPGDKIRVWWGDGTSTDYDTLSHGVVTKISKAYGSFANRSIVIVGNLGHFDANYIDGECAFGGDISTMPCLKFLRTGYTAGTTTTLRGDVSKIDDLTRLEVYGANQLSGDLTKHKNLIYLCLTGGNTVTGDITGMTGISAINIGGSNTIYGSVSGMALGYLGLSGNSSIDVDSIVEVSGTATGMTLLFMNDNYVLSETQVDTILGNFWTNRDATKLRASERYINLGGSGCSVPSAVGVTHRENLSLYMSPNNTGPMVWSVVTN